MIRKTMTITSIAILIAAVSVATTMTLVQADPTGDLVDINVPTAVLGADTGITVFGGDEYSSTMTVVDAVLLFTDSNANGEVDLNEVSIVTAGSGVHTGTFFFMTGTPDGQIDFVDANADNKVQLGELSPGASAGLTVTDLDTATLTATPHPIMVDIDDGTVRIDLTGGSPNTADIVVTIDDIDWAIGGPGAIGSFACSGTTTAKFDANTLWVSISSVVVDTPIDIDCVFEAFHGSINKDIVGDCMLEAKKSTSQMCTFKITYGGDRATIVDTISAGWEEDPVVFVDHEDDDGKCSVDESNGNKGKNKKNNDKSATGFTCVDVGISADFDVTITTRESPDTKKSGNPHDAKVTKFKPTSCEEDFDINSGAKAILLDEFGNVVFGTLDGKPIVLDTSDSLSVTSDKIDCVDA